MKRFLLPSTILEERKRKFIIEHDFEFDDWKIDDDDNVKDPDFSQEEEKEIQVNRTRKIRAPNYSQDTLWQKVLEVNNDEKRDDWQFYRKRVNRPRGKSKKLWYLHCLKCKKAVQYKGYITIENHIFSAGHQHNTGQKKQKIGILIVEEEED